MRGLLVVMVFGFAATVQGAVSQDAIDQFIDHEMPTSAVPGLAYAVVRDGAVTALGARGVMRLGENQAVTPDTPFLTGSISKSFTALAVMQLVEAGRVDLDAPVSRYLDVFIDRPVRRSRSGSY